MSGQDLALEVLAITAVILGLLEGGVAVTAEVALNAASVASMLDDILALAVAAVEGFKDCAASLPQQH